MPGSPSLANDDANSRAGIRVCAGINDVLWGLEMSEEGRSLECSGPPLKVSFSATRWTAWNKRMTNGDAEHGFQGGKICSPFLDNQTGVKKLSIYVGSELG